MPFKHESLLIDSEEDRMTEVEKYVAMKTFHQQIVAMRKGVGAVDQLRASNSPLGPANAHSQQQQQQLLVQQQQAAKAPLVSQPLPVFNPFVPNRPTVPETSGSKDVVSKPATGKADVICIDSDSDDDCTSVRNKASSSAPVAQLPNPSTLLTSEPHKVTGQPLLDDASNDDTGAIAAPNEAAVAKAFAGFIQLQKNMCQQMPGSHPLASAASTVDVLQKLQVQQGDANTPFSYHGPHTASSLSSATAVIAPTPRACQPATSVTISHSTPLSFAPSPLMALINSLQQSNNPAPRKAAIVAPISHRPPPVVSTTPQQTVGGAYLPMMPYPLPSHTPGMSPSPMSLQTMPIATHNVPPPSVSLIPTITERPSQTTTGSMGSTDSFNILSTNVSH